MEVRIISLTILLISLLACCQPVPSADSLLPDPLVVLTNCSQSTTAAGTDCVKAISNTFSADGFPEASICSQTTGSGSSHWWQAQTPSPAPVTFIRVIQPLDCCMGINVSSGNLLVTLDGNDCPIFRFLGFQWSQLFLCNRTGQTVRVMNGVPGPITLCLVQVFAEYLTNVDVDHPRLPLENCSQNSAGSVCNKAIDNSTDQDIEPLGACTYVTSNSWWQVQTPSEMLIKYIRIYSQLTCCVDNPYSLSISVDGSQCALYEGTYFTARDFLCNKTGQTIRITAGGSNMARMPLCEVQAFGEAESKPLDYGRRICLVRCSQSSVAFGGLCGNAIDNRTDQGCSFCSRTQIENGWWQAMTEKLALVSFVRVYLSVDCCFNDRNSISVTVDGKECQPFSQESSPPSVQTLFCNETGRIIRVSSQETSSLAVCEVQAFGEYVSPQQHLLSDAKMLALTDCTQSSGATKRDYCQIAIDGSSDQSRNSCTRTGQRPGWWQARTVKASVIDSVAVYSQLGCSGSNRIYVTIDGQKCSRHQANVDFSVMTFKCSWVGRVIRVSTHSASPLALCEVLALGWPVRRDHRKIHRKSVFRKKSYTIN